MIDTVASPAAESVESLYGRLAGLMHYLSTSRFSVPADDAEALVQDVFVAYVMRTSEVHDPQAWLVGAICHASRKYWRGKDRESAMPEDSAEWADEGALLAVTDVFDRTALEATMSRLDDRGRELLRRFYLEGQSTSAIAAELGTTTGTVQVLLHKTRKRAHAIYRELMEAR